MERGEGLTLRTSGSSGRYLTLRLKTSILPEEGHAPDSKQCRMIGEGRRGWGRGGEERRGRRGEARRVEVRLTVGW